MPECFVFPELTGILTCGLQSLSLETQASRLPLELGRCATVLVKGTALSPPSAFSLVWQLVRPISFSPENTNMFMVFHLDVTTLVCLCYSYWHCRDNYSDSNKRRERCLYLQNENVSKEFYIVLHVQDY